MTEKPNPVERLNQHARSVVPPIDEQFIDRLESDLRVQHAHRQPVRRRLPRLAPRLVVGLAAIALVVSGLFAAVTRLQDEPPVSLDIADQPDEPAPGGGSDADVPSIVVVTPTATITAAPQATTPAVPAPQSSEPTPTPPVGPTPQATLTPEPQVTATASAVPTTTVAPLVPVPATVTPVPSPTVVPATPTVEPTSTPIATVVPTSTAEHTPTPTPEEIDASCSVQTSGDAIGVVCTWTPLQDPTVTGYRLQRSRNRAERETVAEVEADQSSIVDRDVQRGDTIVYAVVALSGDAVHTVSTAITVDA